MSFGNSIEHLVEVSAGCGVEAFASDIDAQWVDDALERPEDAPKMRRRKLPDESVLWLVLGMALFRDHSIALGR